MEEDKLKVWLGFARFIVGTVALGVFTTIINHQIQQREIEIKEQELVGSFLEHALHQDVGVRRRFAQYFSTVTRSDELRALWVNYYDTVNTEYAVLEREKEELERQAQQASLDAVDRERLNTRIAELARALSPRPPPAEERVPARVYIHIRTEQQRAGARDVAKLLSGNAIVVPGIERRPEGPRTSQLRYFRAHDEGEAQAMATLLAEELGVPVEVTYVPGYEASTDLRPRHFELWFAEGALSDSD